MDRRQEHWGFNKKIDVAVVLGMMLQCGVGVWWVSALNSRVSELEHSADKSQLVVAQGGSETTQLKERVLKLEINLANINTKLDEIKDLIAKKR
ncbi:hypothetical protein [Methylomonas koyamae]|uniref:hypothetical protein n=1 Tax=Methylomonas koyamae TaxID=702114 RepID=UPI000A98E8C0|nr:hypothetical protein [Methylomonas koyamae]